MIASIVINSVTMGPYATGYLFTKLIGFASAEARVSVKDRGNYHGAKLSSAVYGRRIMAIEGEIVGADASDFATKRRALEQAVDLYDGLQTMTINTKDSLSLTADVVVNSAFQAEYERGKVIIGPFRIEFVAPYPFLLSSDLVETEVLPFSGGGFSIPFDIPLDMDEGGTGETTVTNNGNARAFPILVINGPVQNPSIKNATTNETLSLTYTLASSTDQIEIDVYNRTVFTNGQNIKQYIGGDWLTLKPGANTLRLTAAGSDANTKLTVQHRHSYLGI